MTKILKFYFGICMAQIFPKSSNDIVKVLGPLFLLFVTGLVVVVWYWFSPRHTDVGYKPKQPVHFSHKLHSGNLGIDCKYCHNSFDKSTFASVPPTQTCMNCHTTILNDSLKLSMVKSSIVHDLPIEWIKVHKSPDYVYFDHSAHITAGVSCKSCHGRVDQMDVLKQDQPLSMSWCLECHRNPTPHLVPLDKVTDLKWSPSSEWMMIAQAKSAALHPPVTDCSGCHR
jgi:NAD-dependent SIR2 family protein deacetylase